MVFEQTLFFFRIKCVGDFSEHIKSKVRRLWTKLTKYHLAFTGPGEEDKPQSLSTLHTVTTVVIVWRKVCGFPKALGVKQQQTEILWLKSSRKSWSVQKDQVITGLFVDRSHWDYFYSGKAFRLSLIMWHVNIKRKWAKTWQIIKPADMWGWLLPLVLILPTFLPFLLLRLLPCSLTGTGWKTLVLFN